MVSDAAVYESDWPPREVNPPSAADEVPVLFRTRLGPEMLAAQTIEDVVEQCAGWQAQVGLYGTNWAESPRARQLLDLVADSSG